MQIATDTKVFIAWDCGDGPTISTGGASQYHHYLVTRSPSCADAGPVLGRTTAQVYFDVNLQPSTLYSYRVFGCTIGEGEKTEVAAYTVRTAADPPKDRWAPTKPYLSARNALSSIVWHWEPSTKPDSTQILGYFVHGEAQKQPLHFLWERDHPTSSWTEPVETGSQRLYQIAAIDKSLNVSERSNEACAKASDGWTVYTFLASSNFTLAPTVTVTADVLLVGGGGSGGGGIEGGGGGAGQMLDLHGVTLVSGGDVTVGECGAEVSTKDAHNNLHGNNGEDSTFMQWTAHGGGYGASEGEIVGEMENAYYAYWYYNAGDGGSGGGGGPWDPDDEWPNPENGDQGPPGKAVYGDGGHDGAPGFAMESAGFIFAGGGGGGADHAGGHQRYDYDQEDYISGWSPRNGGHGVPCNIRGWHGYEESLKTVLFIDWFASGGMGWQRTMGPPDQHAIEGYSQIWSGLNAGGTGGGGFEPGALNTGGGGGGAGYYGGYPDNGRPFNSDAPGMAGGRGIIVVRIQTGDEDLVTYPLITGTDPDPEHNEFGLPICLTDEPHVRIRRLPGYMTHDDAAGDESGPSTWEDRH